MVRPNGGPLRLPATAHGRPRLWLLPTPAANAPNPPPPPTRPPVAHVRARCRRPRWLPPSLGDTLAPALCPRRWPSISTRMAAFSAMVAAPTTMTGMVFHLMQFFFLLEGQICIRRSIGMLAGLWKRQQLRTGGAVPVQESMKNRILCQTTQTAGKYV